ncbi:putative serine/threonine-protein kinase [Aphelenchoides besseyi]|nr:putative serine/threonine-protein kinase [Aphelenchoides besseyi]
MSIIGLFMSFNRFVCVYSIHNYDHLWKQAFPWFFICSLGFPILGFLDFYGAQSSFIPICFPNAPWLNYLDFDVHIVINSWVSHNTMALVLDGSLTVPCFVLNLSTIILFKKRRGNDGSSGRNANRLTTSLIYMTIGDFSVHLTWAIIDYVIFISATFEFAAPAFSVLCALNVHVLDILALFPVLLILSCSQTLRKEMLNFDWSCGTVYLVQSAKHPGIEGRAAMKVEPFMKHRDDEILKMEVFVLRKMQPSKHACRLLSAGKEKNFSYMVISLLGKELSELRRRYPDRKMPAGTTLKIGLQCLQAVQDLHIAGFVHRDIKPTNFACGAVNRHVIYIFDFGLARQYLTSLDGKGKLRDPRTKVSFRGTVRYCSVNVHQYKEQGRHDDLWSLLYMLIELLTSSLPRDSGALKETVTDARLCQGCPPSFGEINGALKKLTYNDTPNYDQFRELFKRDLNAVKGKTVEPFEWEMTKPKAASEEPHVQDKDEKAEIDKMEDTDTHRDVDESVESAMSDQESNTKGFAKEDTLEGCADVNK